MVTIIAQTALTKGKVVLFDLNTTKHALNISQRKPTNKTNIFYDTNIEHYKNQYSSEDMY